jgi:Cu/Ag efflux protein CusF
VLVRILSTVLVASSLLGASARCSRPAASAAADAAAAPAYSANGTVRSVDTAAKTMLIAHDEIPGFMKAMTMEFDLRDAEQAKGLARGDRIAFTFTDEGKGHLVIQTLRKLP